MDAYKKLITYQKIQGSGKNLLQDATFV